MYIKFEYRIIIFFIQLNELLQLFPVTIFLNFQVKELEQVEQMELETLAEALPTSKALREKKLKMKETIDRVIKCYEKESDKEMVCVHENFVKHIHFAA